MDKEIVAMILEGVVTTLSADNELNVAPMGPVCDEAQTTFLLRPFQSSTTFQNLRRNPCGVLHVVDDVLLIARAAIGELNEAPATFAAETIEGRVLECACRYFEFRVSHVNDSQPRAELQIEVVKTVSRRDFWGFNRARHAVLEAAILATRVHLIEPIEIANEFRRLQSPIDKTAGPREIEAFELLKRYVKLA